ncbi:MAG: hypothetical protein IIV87_02100 [Oscillospiraceae bacterium]|nr:hypothetical protein [Oscillospiraceae bacterium]MBQ5748928.1 hypothetical protein [Oscillospiraceae bacterium]
MTLRQISEEYRRSQEPIRERLRLLRREEKVEKDPQRLFWIRRRKQMLSTMLQELRDLAELTEHYYERGYYRNEKYRL